MSCSFDRVSGIYDATRGVPSEVSEQITNCILDHAAATPDAAFLEPGIGTGRIALPILERGYAYTGVDISSQMMDELRRKVESKSYRLTLVQADATALPFEDNSFDVALTVHLFHLIPNWQQALAEIRRVLKPGGVYFYSHGRVNAIASEYVDRANQDWFEVDQQWRQILANHDFHLSAYGATEEEVVNQLTEYGATLETVVAARWQVQQTVSELLHRYQNKMYSSCWQIPDEVFSVAIKELEEWCQQRYSSPDIALFHNMKFKVVVARNL